MPFRTFWSLLLIPAMAACAPKGDNTSHRLMAGGMPRTYLLHTPPSLPAGKAVPLVLVFHGSGDVGAGIADLTQFSAVADREGFLVAYPDAYDHNWNDAREVPGILSQSEHINDIALAAAVIADVSERHSVDPHRIYAAGFSNGGIFCHYLASQRSGRFAAVAAVGGGIAEPLAPKFKPEGPLSVFIIHGTKDPFVPYHGGNVDYSENGRIISMEETLRHWQDCLGCKGQPKTGELPDKDLTDHCQVHWSRWRGARQSEELLLYTVEGGGHAWPGGPQFQPVSVIGYVCRDFDATEAIWTFFKEHPKP